MKTSLLAMLAFAACVKIPQDVEATFAGPSAQEDSNFRRNANGAPHLAFEHAAPPPDSGASTVPVASAPSEAVGAAPLADPRDGGVE